MRFWSDGKRGPLAICSRLTLRSATHFSASAATHCYVPRVDLHICRLSTSRPVVCGVTGVVLALTMRSNLINAGGRDPRVAPTVPAYVSPLGVIHTFHR